MHKGEVAKGNPPRITTEPEECSPEFIKDLEMLIEDFRKYREENPGIIKIPDL